MNREKRKENDIAMALELLHSGRPVSFVKSVTNITIAQMVRSGWLREVIIPDPAGYDMSAHGVRNHNGNMLHTGRFLSIFIHHTVNPADSAKKTKKIDRKAHFGVLRETRKLRWIGRSA